MSSATMRTAVLQATIIFTISQILGHHLSENMFDEVWKDEVFLNMTSVLNQTTPYASANSTSRRLTIESGTTTNTTSLNRALTINNATSINATTTNTSSSSQSIYSWKLPREVAIMVVISALQYYWFIWLEKMLPARPRRKDVPYQRHEKIEESEGREEEIVKRWIAQGRVKRASLNWCNTFLKWVVELTIGRLWYHAHLFFNFTGTYFSTTPLAMLVAFIIIPAHKQIVFMESAQLVETVFFVTLVRLFAVWVVKTSFVQDMMRNVTSSALDGSMNQGAKGPGFKNEL
ncbi:hypothetical protein EK21DRAFT_59322 [Setomelanomma holmii]|uniref:Uncharacterized protein n=1 Tax=Setomelanomma holmii TaxID=210430 RepID=A0A9P4LQU9_9PLEO|nr:hypothetical protein EK21DRAFT_59322 [Setomelanomma holmii]